MSCAIYKNIQQKMMSFMGIQRNIENMKKLEKSYKKNQLQFCLVLQGITIYPSYHHVFYMIPVCVCFTQHTFMIF